jgi:hypothetical protein
MISFIDYSQYYSWMKCPGMWYERSVNKRHLPYPDRQRDDALAIGSMVHGGLEIWNSTKEIRLPTEIDLTPEAYRMCLDMIQGYAMHYPQEEWALQKCEDPLRFPLIRGELQIDGLAKVDHYFFVPKLTTVESGVEGETIDLHPGWWVNEYKTKDPGIAMGIYSQRWNANMQASFQMLALQYLISKMTQDPNDIVQGILVNVIDKPKIYWPRRKCKSCQELYDFDLWHPTGVEEMYSCPICGASQKLVKRKEFPSQTPARYYRILVQRSPERLEKDFQQISKVAECMRIMKEGGLESFPWNFESCVDLRSKKACEYYGNHLEGNGISTIDDSRMVMIEDYVKETPNG